MGVTQKPLLTKIQDFMIFSFFLQDQHIVKDVLSDDAIKEEEQEEQEEQEQEQEQQEQGQEQEKEGEEEEANGGGGMCITHRNARLNPSLDYSRFTRLHNC